VHESFWKACCAGFEVCWNSCKGITTDEIDKAVHQMIVDNGAYPSPLGYCGYPKSVCTSVNECICHGIPDSRPLEDGDIINIDVTVYLNGYHGDTSATFLCGDVDDEAKKLVQVTKECLDKAISICAPGVEIKRIGRTIQYVIEKLYHWICICACIFFISIFS
jgi:methionyl aminopeptidase